MATEQRKGKEHEMTQKVVKERVKRWLMWWGAGLRESTEKSYLHALDEFLAWHDRSRSFCARARMDGDRILDMYRRHLIRQGYAGSTVDSKISAVSRTLDTSLRCNLFSAGCGWIDVAPDLPGMMEAAQRRADKGNARDLVLLRFLESVALPAKLAR